MMAKHRKGQKHVQEITTTGPTGHKMDGKVGVEDRNRVGGDGVWNGRVKASHLTVRVRKAS